MKYYRLMTLLPPLPAAPERPPCAVGDLIELCADELDGRALLQVRTLLGILDCRNLEAFLQGSDAFDDRALLTRASFEARTDLPDYALSCLKENDSTEISPESGWQVYFAHVLEVAEQTGSRFLRQWATSELGLRSQLVEYRVQSMVSGRDRPAPEVVVEPPDGVTPLLSALQSEPDPMERERLLDRWRLDHLHDMSGVDAFSLDSVLAYVAATLVLDRWDFVEHGDATHVLESFT